ncbi:hypothetical protein [Winogradskyella sp.]|uniref:hypothetical protein n=1 Tax=Winogradskyella sp. TaxID=1883156 RepID=UPI0025EDF200|nr:hypothetical protein [Winogradskyella sp.]MBT8244553.1 hypothetical protein [Winogradskyella sp.]
MKNIFKLLFVLSIIVSFSNCTSEETSNIDNQEVNELLKAPNNVILENSFQILGERITGKKEGVEILDINYIDLPKDFKGLVANVEYSVDGEIKEVMIIRNIFELKFEKDTVIQFSKIDRSNSSVSAREGDIYISCSGAGCCHPSGTYNPNTGEITTSCKCEGNPGGNSSCIMKISDTKPSIDDAP